MAIGAPHFGLMTLVPYFLCLWMVEKNKNNTKGLFWVFALTGWLGFTLGPILNMYLAVKGADTIMLALGSTALVFFCIIGLCFDYSQKPQFYGRVFNGWHVN